MRTRSLTIVGVGVGASVGGLYAFTQRLEARRSETLTVADHAYGPASRRVLIVDDDRFICTTVSMLPAPCWNPSAN